MNATSIELSQIEDEVRTNEVSDESLEAAAVAETLNAGNYTLGSCTGFISCPA